MNYKKVPLMDIRKQDSFHIDDLLQNVYESKDTQTFSSIESLKSKFYVSIDWFIFDCEQINAKNLRGNFKIINYTTEIK